MVDSPAADRASLDERHFVFLRRSAAFVLMLGPGCAVAFFVALVGFYIYHFESPAFFVAMLFCAYLPYPIMTVLQEKLDSYFDERFSTRATYFVRVVMMQIILAGACLGWMFSPQSPYFVLFWGLVIGTIAGAINSSSMQLVTTLEPELSTYTRLGNQLGSVVPVVALFVLDFRPSASLHDFRLALATVPVLCTIAGIYLTYLHFGHDLFAKAFQRLAYDLDDAVPGLQDSGRQYSETTPLVSKSVSGISEEAVSPGVPTWIWYWISSVGVMTTSVTCLLSLSGYFGDESLAQKLCVTQLVVSVIGRLMALPIPSVPTFEDDPWHVIFVTGVFVYFLLAAIVAAHLANVDVHQAIFLLAWGVSFALYNFLSSLVDLTTALYARVERRKLVARRGHLAMVSGGLLGLAISTLLIFADTGRSTKWPAADRVIES